METASNVSKRGSDVNQSECPIPGEAGLVDTFCNEDPDADMGIEPNFNLNLNLTSPSNPRPLAETSKLHGGTKKDEGNKGAGKSEAKVAAVTGKWSNTVKTILSPEEKQHAPWQKSKIPALSRSPTAERLVHSRGEPKLKSPNPKRAPALSPNMHTHGRMAASPKPRRQEQMTAAVSPTPAERPKPPTAHALEAAAKSSNKAPSLKLQSSRKEDCGRESRRKMQPPVTLHVPVNVHKGDTKVSSPKPASRTPTLAGNTHKPDRASTSVKAHEQVRHDSRTHNPDVSSVGPKFQTLKAEMALLSTKTPAQRSPSPKPSTQRKVTGTTNSNTSDSKENLHSKDSSVSSVSKTSSKSSSNSKATMVTKDGLESQSETHLKVSHKSKTTMGSKDSLDSKSGYASKTSWGSKDSLDSKTSSNSKASSEAKPGMVSKDNIDPKTQTPSPSFTQMASKTVLVGSGFNTDHVGSVLPSSSGCIDSNLTSSSTKSGSDLTAEPDSFKSGPVRSSAKSALADLSSSLALSPRPSSGRSPGPGKRLGSVPSGPSREALRSPGSAPGSGGGHLPPLTTSSPKTTSTAKAGCTQEPTPLVVEETNPSNTSHNTGLTRGLTFDSTTTTPPKSGAAVKGEHLKPCETKGTPVRGSVISHESGWSPGDPRKAAGKPDHLADKNAASTIPSSRAVGVESKEGEKKQEKGKDGHGLGCSSLPLHPLPLQSTHPSKSKRVGGTAAMMDPGERQREVGVQVEAKMVERSASTSPSLHRGAPTSSESPSCQTGTVISPAEPSLCCVPAGRPPFQHICRIDLELSSRSALPSVVTDKPGVLPGSLRTSSFQQSPALMLDLGPGQDPNRDASTDNIWEHGGGKQEKGDRKMAKRQSEGEKPQDVAWDAQGMTWQVYGASMDLETLGAAIQSHLESKIRQQEKHIRILRRVICTGRRLRRKKMKRRRRRRKRRGGILGCCREQPAVAD